MDNLQFLVDLHKDAARQGPGSEAETCLAVSLSGLRGERDLRIADIGCGTGASTLILAKELDAHITAVDILPEFLKALERAAAETGVLVQDGTSQEETRKKRRISDTPPVLEKLCIRHL